MDPSRVLLALQEQTKWRERRKRVEERIRQIQSRKRYFLKELDVARQRVAQFGALLVQLKGGVVEEMETRLSELFTVWDKSISGRDLILMALATGKYDRACRKIGVRVASEGFADRAYNVDCTLVSRKIAGSLITDPERAAAQAVRMAAR